MLQRLYLRRLLGWRWCLGWVVASLVATAVSSGCIRAAPPPLLEVREDPWEGRAWPSDGDGLDVPGLL